MRELTMNEVASMFGRAIAPLGKRSSCPIRNHKRADKTFSLFRTSEGKTLWKCFSCDSPNNCGDALKLYALLSGVERKEAWHALREMGYAVPGAKDGPERPSRPPLRKITAPIDGRSTSPKEIIPLPADRWHEIQQQRLGAVERFAKLRCLKPEVLRSFDVVDMAHDAVGFGYRNPSDGTPCRVKARALDRKTFWIEPRSRSAENAVALSPLYLAHKLSSPDGLQSVVVITEGEVDALTLQSVGIGNAVSLPDGSSSASKVDLKPVWYRASLVLSAVDADDEGDKAHRELYSRSVAMQKPIARVRWQLQGGRLYKDANEALVDGWEREQFIACLQQAAKELRGYEVTLATAS